MPALPIRRSATSLVLALALIAAMSVFFVREVVELRQAMVLLRQNDTACIQLRNVMTHLLNAETGQRGYLLTGEPGYLEPYLVGRNGAPASLLQAEQSGYGDQRFLATIRNLAHIADSKLDELDRTVQMKKRGDGAAAANIVREGFGQQKMREARRLIQEEVERLRVLREGIMQGFNDRLLRSAAILALMLSTVVAMAVHAWRSLCAAARRNNELARRLALEASHDALTGLPNRRFFERCARRLVARSRRSGKPFTLLALDLDRFKEVNDAHGHALGDEVLREAGRRFQAVLRGGELLARLGGDEFVVLVEGEFSRHDIAGIGLRLIDCLHPPLHPTLAEISVGTSIGVASFPRNGADLEGLMQAADDALYAAKHGGRGRLCFAHIELTPPDPQAGSLGQPAPCITPTAG
ncbi:diguanylate cyclase [Massilia sp. UMI-21]|nr:diguanylate cyclase [Massilia sp. UMI-21]